MTRAVTYSCWDSAALRLCYRRGRMRRFSLFMIQAYRIWVVGVVAVAVAVIVEVSYPRPFIDHGMMFLFEMSKSSPCQPALHSTIKVCTHNILCIVFYCSSFPFPLLLGFRD